MLHGIFQFTCHFHRYGNFCKYFLVPAYHFLLETYKCCFLLKVRSSALIIPEFIDPQDDSEKYLFAYSIRLSLEPQGCLINGMSFNSCQLHWRHWIIRANDDVVSDVNGEAVIGQV